MSRKRIQRRNRNAMYRAALLATITKLNPRHQLRNPVMFVVYVGALVTLLLFIQATFGKGEAAPAFILQISVWLWLTVIFANFAEAIAEGRGKAQAETLRKTRSEVQARKLSEPSRTSKPSRVAASALRKGDIVMVEAGEVIPGDGEVIEGAASVDESAIQAKAPQWCERAVEIAAQ